MGLSGQLSTMPLGDLIQWIHLGRKTGSLQVEILDFKKLIYLQNGSVFFASSSKEKERLGQFLVHRKLITEADLAECLRIWKEQKAVMKLSEIIVGRGLMSNEKMLRCIGDLVQEIVYDLFLYEDGYFEFDEAVPPEVKQSFQLDSQWLMFEGLRRLDEFRRNASRLPAADQVLVRNAAAAAGLVEKLDKDARLLYDMIDGRRDVENLVHACPLSAYDAQMQLMTLLMNNLVSLRRMDARELQERRVSRVVDRVGNALGQGDVDSARELMSQVAGQIDSRPELQALRTRLDKAIAAEVEKMTGGQDRRLIVDPEVLRGQRQETLTAEQGFVLSRVAEGGSVREVVLTAGFPKSQAYELIYSLLRMGLISAVDTAKQLETYRRTRY